jgi:2-alkenal reductase
VAEVVAGSPADKAGLHGSDRQVTIDGQQVSVGGDVIIAIDDQPVKEMDDLIAYLSAQTEVGQKVSLTVLRDGKEKRLEATLAARPGQEQSQPQPAKATGQAWLGILGLALNPEIAREMNLAEDQQGVLVQRVDVQSPADEANLRGSDKQVMINGTQVLVGGDVITALDGKQVANVEELAALIQEAGAGTQVTLTILRDGKTLDVQVTLATKPG